MVMDILVYFQVFLTGWASCYFFMVWRLRQALKKVAEDNGMTLEEMAETFLQTRGIKTVTVPNYFTETNGNSILLYNKDTGAFVNQAMSLDELAKNVYQFNKIVFAQVNHNDGKYWFIEGKVENNLK